MFFDECKKKNLIIGDDPPILIDGTEISNYFFKGNSKEYWLMSDPAFHNCAPPWPEIWVEFQAPDLVVSREEGITKWKGPKSWSCWMKYALPPKPFTDQYDFIIMSGVYVAWKDEI